MTRSDDVRRVRCPTCGARRYNNCRNSLGERLDWCHVDRLILADQPALGRPRRSLPPEVKELKAQGVPRKEIARRTGIANTTLMRHGL